MAGKNTNDKKGEEAVQQLSDLLRASVDIDVLRHCQLKVKELNLFKGEPEYLKIKKVIRAGRRAKTDIFVEFEGLSKPLAIAVISASSGNNNHVERRKVEFYRKDLGIEDIPLRLLKLLTGAIKPEDNSAGETVSEPAPDAQYVSFSELTETAKDTLIDQLASVRDQFVKKALLGRGNATKCKDGKKRIDEAALIAFCDQKDASNIKWTICDGLEVISAITKKAVSASKAEGNQINLGRGIFLKRYGGGSKKGDLSQKDQLQVQINPRELFSSSTDLGFYREASYKLGLNLVEPELEDTEEVELPNGATTNQAKAAKRGLEAEDALAYEICQHNPECRWIVEESTGSNDYSTYAAKSPENNEKADVLIYPSRKPERIDASLSIKTYRPDVSFGHVNRGSIESYAKVFKFPGDIVTTFKKYLQKGPNGERTKFKKMPPEESGKVFRFLRSIQSDVIRYIFCGAADSKQKADWILLHSYTDENWRFQVGRRDNWRLYKLEDVIKACCSIDPQPSPKGDLVIGSGVTAQRKGADKTDKRANDLQFKMSPNKIIELMEMTRAHRQEGKSLK